MDIDRDKMVSENVENNGVKRVNTKPSVSEIKYNNIPAWILLEVLITMPIKLVFTSKLVSKHWQSLILHPSFVLAYTMRASQLHLQRPWTFIADFMYGDGFPGFDFSTQKLLDDIHFTDIKPPSVHALRCPSAQNPDEQSYKILGVSDGLVLYICGACTDSMTNYYICNPFTKQWITLPLHARRLKIVSNGFVTRVENGVLKSYRVVRFDMFFRKGNSVIIEVFSSETGEWKEFDVCVDREIQVMWLGCHTSYNGILHWLTRKNEVVAYDPYHNPQCLRIIALPGNVHPKIRDAKHIDVFQGRLSYIQVSTKVSRQYYYNSSGFSSISVWVLNDYSTGDWSLHHKICSSDIIYDSIFRDTRVSLKPMSFHPFDSDKVYFRCGNMIVSYDIKSRRMEAHGRPILDTDIWPTAFLFVAPPWPVHIPQLPSGIVGDK